MTSHWIVRLRVARSIGSLIVIAGLLGPAVFGQSASSTDAEDTRERLVMLASGRILVGQVSRNAGGYLVEQPNGRVQVPNDDVLFVVNDLREAYRKQRDAVRYPTPASHVALANWCISYRLYDEARDELRKSLKSDPENEEARRLLQRLTDTVRANLPPVDAPPPIRKSLEGFVQPDVESLGGLKRETATQFTSKVQPILLNKCGNAACHGTTSSNGFRLISARIGGNGSRQNTERNLAEAMKFIDYQDVGASRLLSMSTSAHGGKGTIFVGPAGTEQLKLLKSWARSVAEEKHASTRELENRPTIVDKKSAQKSRRGFETSDVKPASFATAKSNEPEPESDLQSIQPRELPAETDDIEPAEVLKPLDPFDPELFNRRPR